MHTAGNYAGITVIGRQFLQHACTDIKYGHIAALVKVWYGTVASYRASVFARFNVQSRTGMIVGVLKRRWWNFDEKKCNILSW